MIWGTEPTGPGQMDDLGCRLCGHRMEWATWGTYPWVQNVWTTWGADPVGTGWSGRLGAQTPRAQGRGLCRGPGEEDVGPGQLLRRQGRGTSGPLSADRTHAGTGRGGARCGWLWPRGDLGCGNPGRHHGGPTRAGGPPQARAPHMGCTPSQTSAPRRPSHTGAGGAARLPEVNVLNRESF